MANSDMTSFTSNCSATACTIVQVCKIDSAWSASSISPESLPSAECITDGDDRGQHMEHDINGLPVGR